MIVLDEQLLGRGIEHDIARWYRGRVRFVIDLRPNTVIKDDAIPALLQQQSQPTFVTINDRDFWQRTPCDARYCMVCFAWSDGRIGEIPQALRSVFRLSEFRTKGQRMGKIVRVTRGAVFFYDVYDRQVRTIVLGDGH